MTAAELGPDPGADETASSAAPPTPSNAASEATASAEDLGDTEATLEAVDLSIPPPGSERADRDERSN